MLQDLIKKEKEFVIFGAQVVAYGAYEAIRHMYNRIPSCFAVGNTDGNPPVIDGIPVHHVSRVRKDVLIVVGVTELVQKEVLPFLKSNGYENLYVLTQHEEHLLMSSYYDSMGLFECVCCNGEAAETGTDLKIYEVNNHRDTPLLSHPMLNPWECPIQAGASVTDVRIAGITDNTGINISEKNRQYCEMTAAYWVWKNTAHDWKGIEHYRRHLLVSPSMLKDDVDVILPLPYMCYPDEMSQFGRFVDGEVSQLLLEALRHLHPHEYDAYNDILFGRYQYTYNLVCARRAVFDEYCGWFFNITEYMETFGDKVTQVRETRALSYVAEVLTNLYFMYNQNNYKILHAEKGIYV